MTAAHLGSLTLNGRDVVPLAFDAVKGGLRPTTLEGRPPMSEDEVGLGAEVARRLGVGVGDEVDALGTVGTARPLRVVGIVVTPDSAGNGAAMSFDGYAELSPTATKNVVFIRFRDGAPADVADVVAAASYSPPGALVTPTSVRALQRVTAAPLVLGLVLAVLLTVASAYLIATSVSARSRDLAVLRALGCNRRQLPRDHPLAGGVGDGVGRTGRAARRPHRGTPGRPTPHRRARHRSRCRRTGAAGADGSRRSDRDGQCARARAGAACRTGQHGGAYARPLRSPISNSLDRSMPRSLTSAPVFERFTDRARRVVVLSQEEARPAGPHLHRHRTPTPRAVARRRRRRREGAQRARGRTAIRASRCRIDHR